MRPPLTLLAVALGLATTAAAQQDFSKVEIKIEKVAGSVYMLTGAGGNIGLSIGDDGVVMVDDQFAPLAPRIREALRKVTDKPLRFLLNTHFHGDHSGGNAPFSAEATIIAHDNVRQRLQTPAPGASPNPKEALPVITFDRSLTVHLNGEDVRALHFASGHTDGDSIIFFPKANVVHMGDDFVTYGLPFIDVASGGTIRGMIDNVEKAMASLPDDVKIIPGHGPISTKADVKKFTDMLRDCVALVDAAIKAGKALDQMKTDGVLAKYEPLGQGFVKTAGFVELIEKELRGEK